MPNKDGKRILTDEDCENIIKSYENSKGAQKMWNYFLEITKKDYFTETIKEIRKKYNIPENGFIDSRCMMPPENLEDRYNTIEKIRDEIVNKICKKYRLHYFDYSEVLLDFVCYNYLNPIGELTACGLFRLVDVIGEKEEPYGELLQQSDDMAYPIAIRISPYASQRDIIDFVKNKSIWKMGIEPLQEKYKDEDIKIGQVKTKNEEIQKRNDFIYENREKPRKEIMKLLTDKFPELDPLDYGHIAKIISLENKRRKEV